MLDGSLLSRLRGRRYGPTSMPFCSTISGKTSVVIVHLRDRNHTPAVRIVTTVRIHGRDGNTEATERTEDRLGGRALDDGSADDSPGQTGADPSPAVGGLRMTYRVTSAYRRRAG